MDSSVKDKYQNKYPHPVDSPVDKTNDLVFIETDKDFIQAIHRLSKAPFLALDLEADSLFHFTEKICLIQMTAGRHIYIIDPLAIQDMTPLASVLSNPRIRKIIHGADYDIRSLYRDYHIAVENLFDTELAARLLGYSETGLESVLKQKFNITLEKKFQKKDWSQRPLPGDMIDYAAKDVKHLIELYELQVEELNIKKRMEWVLEECEILSKVRNQNNDDSPLFTRVKGAGRLDPRGLAVLETLLKFRLDLARNKDRPAFKIIGNNCLLEIAQKQPVSEDRLKDMAVLSEKQFHRYGRYIVDATQKALAIPRRQLPRYPHQRLSFNDSALSPKIKKLKTWRQQKAQTLKMDAGVMLNNSILKTVAEKNPGSIDDVFAINEMKNWQKKEFGHEMLAVLKNADS
jgi:ribonuclease D